MCCCCIRSFPRAPVYTSISLMIRAAYNPWPAYLVSCILQVLRLSLQAEVKAGEAKARRSKTTGSLVVTMPKVDPHQVRAWGT